MFSAPAPAEQDEGHEEGHVDAYRGGGGRDHDVGLGSHDLVFPEGAELPRLLEVGSVDLGGLGEKREIGNEAAADLSPVEFPGGTHGNDDAEEGDDDQSDHDLEDPVENLDPPASPFVIPDHENCEGKQDGAADNLGRDAVLEFR